MLYNIKLNDKLTWGDLLHKSFVASFYFGYENYISTELANITLWQLLIKILRNTMKKHGR